MGTECRTDGSVAQAVALEDDDEEEDGGAPTRCVGLSLRRSAGHTSSSASRRSRRSSYSASDTRGAASL